MDAPDVAPIARAEHAAHDIVTACSTLREALALSKDNTEFSTVWRITREAWKTVDTLAAYAGGAANERE